jgi:CDP-diacylglycerol--serine O-phosphatidyltransferase
MSAFPSLGANEEEDGDQNLWIERILSVLCLFYMSGLVEYAGMEICKRNPHWRINRPLHATWFGPSKTYRSFVMHPLINTLLCIGMYYGLQMSLHPNVLQWEDVFWLGCVGGFIWPLGELPNSFVKRKLGIRAGECRTTLQWIVDHTDSVSALLIYLGCIGWPLYYLVLTLPVAVSMHGFYNLSTRYFCR